MYRFARFPLLAILGLLLIRPAPAAPDDGGAPPAPNPPSWFQIGGQVRGRFDKSDALYLSRIRVDLGVRPTRWLRFFLQAQDARGAASHTYSNPLDLRQGYVELNSEGGVSARLRAGRQELSFGGERLIGPADWGMSRTFDAVDLSLTRGRAALDLMAGSPVQTDARRFDRHKPGDHFYGVYGSVKGLASGMVVEPYILFHQIRPLDSVRASPGLRVTGKLAGGFDYAGETVIQHDSRDARRVSAHAATLTLGWTVRDVRWKPRFSAEYNYASNSFDQFYPSNHNYYGMIDLFGWRNIRNYRAGFDFAAAKKLKVRADFNDFYLASVQDSLYGSSGASIALNRDSTSAHVGSELNSVAVYQWTKIWKFGAGLGHLYAGSYLKQSRHGFGYTYPYLMFVGSF
jgi:alginate export protein